jgi:four helix bundle protein
MFLQLVYKDLEIISLSKTLVQKCYELSGSLPEDEKKNIGQQIKNAALNTYLKLSEGAFLNKKKRKRCFTDARVSIILLDANLEAFLQLGFSSEAELQDISFLLVSCYKKLNKLIKKK